MGSVLDSLRDRKVVQWTLGYLATAWALVQVVGLLGDQFGWSAPVVRTFTVAAFLGVLPVGVFAWFHGERGAQRITPTELALLLAAGLVVVGAATYTYSRGREESLRAEAAAQATAFAALAEAQAAMQAAADKSGDDRREWETAAEKYRAVVAIAPALIDGWLGMFDTARKVWQRFPDRRAATEPEVRAALERLEALAPDDPRTLIRRAKIKDEFDGDSDGFRRTLEAVLEKDPGNLDAILPLLAVLEDLERWDEVHRRVTAALAKAPKERELWLELGDAEVVRRDWPAARRAFDRALELTETPDYKLYGRRAAVEMHAGDLEAFDRYLEGLRPVFQRTYRWIYARWMVHMAKGETELAIAEIEAADAEDMGAGDKDDMLATSHFIAGDRARAARLLRAVVERRRGEIDDTQPVGLRIRNLAVLGQALAMSGARDEAIATLDRAAALLPTEGPWTGGMCWWAPFIAIWYGAADAPDKAVGVIERALVHPHPTWSPNAIWLHHDGEPLRGDPAWEAVLRKAGADTSQGSRPPKTRAAAR